MDVLVGVVVEGVVMVEGVAVEGVTVEGVAVEGVAVEGVVVVEGGGVVEGVAVVVGVVVETGLGATVEAEPMSAVCRNNPNDKLFQFLPGFSIHHTDHSHLLSVFGNDSSKNSYSRFSPFSFANILQISSNPPVIRLTYLHPRINNS